MAGRIKFSELYCRNCRMSYTAVEAQCNPNDLMLPECKGGSVHIFTDQIPPEDKRATVPAHGTLQ